MLIQIKKSTTLYFKNYKFKCAIGKNGIKKNKTKIEDNVFVGSNASLVAPIKLGKSSIVGAGSVITQSVKEKALAVERNLQKTFPNYRKNRKK